MIILLLLFTIIVIYLHFKNKTVENFENTNKISNIISFTKENPFENGGVLLNNNEGFLHNATSLISKIGTVSIAYSLYDKIEKGILLYIPDNYCEISLESKDEKIHIFLSYLNTTYHYQINRYVYRNKQHNLIISLLLNNKEHELYINNEKLYYYDYNLRNAQSTQYSMIPSPIIINKNKKLKGVLYGLITHNKVLNTEEIKDTHNQLVTNFINKPIQKKPIKKIIPEPVNIPLHCNFDNKDICDNCSLAKIDLENYKIIYENDECEKKIKGYCYANKDYICDIIDVTNKLGNN